MTMCRLTAHSYAECGGFMKQEELEAYYDLLSDEDKHTVGLLGVSVILDLKARISDILTRLSDEKNN